jgi:hypothetical protein
MSVAGSSFCTKSLDVDELSLLPIDPYTAKISAWVSRASRMPTNKQDAMYGGFGFVVADNRFLFSINEEGSFMNSAFLGGDIGFSTEYPVDCLLYKEYGTSKISLMDLTLSSYSSEDDLAAGILENVQSPIGAALAACIRKPGIRGKKILKLIRKNALSNNANVLSIVVPCICSPITDVNPACTHVIKEPYNRKEKYNVVIAFSTEYHLVFAQTKGFVLQEDEHALLDKTLDYPRSLIPTINDTKPELRLAIRRLDLSSAVMTPIVFENGGFHSNMDPKIIQKRFVECMFSANFSDTSDAINPVGHIVFDKELPHTGIMFLVWAPFNPELKNWEICRQELKEWVEYMTNDSSKAFSHDDLKNKKTLLVSAVAPISMYS